HLHTTDLDDAVALLPFKAGGFGVEDDLAHCVRELRCGWGSGKRCQEALPARWRIAASRASTSTRSLSTLPAWPLTQCQLMRWRAVAACSRSHRSRFLTGSPPAVFQP